MSDVDPAVAGAPLLVRLMTEADVAQTASVSAAAFEFELADADMRERWEERMRHPLRTDPGGSFVAERDGELVGVGQAIIRDQVWILSLLTVDPTVHSAGAGRALMRAALDYGADIKDGLIVASNDSRALRLYGNHGFRLMPTFEAKGKVDPNLIPDLDPEITVVPEAEVATLAPISCAIRGAAYTRDFPITFDRGGTVFRLGQRGFVITVPGHGVWGPIALDPEAATALLWRALAHLRDAESVSVSFVSAAQQWAIDVFLAARLPFKSNGALAVRGNPGPLYPYIPSPPFA